MQIIGVGKSSFVSRESESKTTVIKQIFPGFDAELKFEHHVYEWLGSHPRLAKFHGPVDQGIELEYYPLGNIDKFPKMEHDLPYLKWSEQIAEGLAYIHSKGVIHCDLRTANILVTACEDAVIADFGSSMLDGVKVSEIENHHRYRPCSFNEPGYMVTVQDDIFAFGTLVYYLVTRKEPYEEKTTDEVVNLYFRGKFPDVSGLPMSEIIQNCWTGKYSSAGDVLESIRNLRSTSLLEKS